MSIHTCTHTHTHARTRTHTHTHRHTHTHTHAHIHTHRHACLIQWCCRQQQVRHRAAVAHRRPLACICAWGSKQGGAGRLRTKRAPTQKKTYTQTQVEHMRTLTWGTGLQPRAQPCTVTVSVEGYICHWEAIFGARQRQHRKPTKRRIAAEALGQNSPI